MFLSDEGIGTKERPSPKIQPSAGGTWPALCELCHQPARRWALRAGGLHASPAAPCRPLDTCTPARCRYCRWPHFANEESLLWEDLPKAPRSWQSAGQKADGSLAAKPALAPWAVASAGRGGERDSGGQCRAIISPLHSRGSSRDQRPGTWRVTNVARQVEGF